MNIVEMIEATLDKIRPFLHQDGGGVDFLYFADGIVHLRVLGACGGCMFQGEHIDYAIEQILVEEVPGVIGLKTHEENEVVTPE